MTRNIRQNHKWHSRDGLACARVSHAVPRGEIQREIGLDELLVSTGEKPSKWLPTDRIASAEAVAGAAAGRSRHRPTAS